MDSNGSPIGRTSRGPLLLPRAAEPTNDASQAPDNAPRVDVLMTDRIDSNKTVANVHQSDLHPAQDDRKIVSDIGSPAPTDLVFHNESQRIPKDNTSPSDINLRQEPDGGSGIDERRSPQHIRQSPLSQSFNYEGVGPESVTASAKVAFKKTEWERLICHECLNAEHLVKHRKFSTYQFKGRTGALDCGHRRCQKWMSSLKASNFISSPDCNHNHNSINNNIINSVSEDLASQPNEQLLNRNDNGQHDEDDPQQPHAMVSRSAIKLHARPGNGMGKIVKRSQRQVNSNITRRVAGLLETTTVQNGDAVVSEQDCTSSTRRQPQVPSGVVMTNGNVPQGVESFNRDILDTYHGKNIEDNKVEESWLRIATKISEFDGFVRDVASSKDVRGKLGLLDNITPFSALQEIAEEYKLPDKYENQSVLLWLFKSMLNIPIGMSFNGAINDQIRQLKFPHVLQATIAYLLHQRIFTVPERKSEWKEMEKSAVELFGGRLGAEISQFFHLRAHKSDNFKERLKFRASEIAHTIYNTLLLFYQLAADVVANHNQERQLELLTRLTHDCLALAMDLHARKGAFYFIWPAYESRFDPEIHSVHASQSEAVSRMADEVIYKQMIAFAFMPVVQRVLPYEEEEVLTYAQGVVLLKEPYAE